jgi:3',5'-cyclic AMP phosphodiesterase CpdA
MRRIAHLSDVHTLDRHVLKRYGRYRLATKLVSLGRSIDALDRGGRLARALAYAKASGADHYVISGDLTEVGEPLEFEHFAEILHDARLPEGSVTLVPGNHDAYTEASAWAKAIAGPLAAFASTSAAPWQHRHGAPPVVERGDVVFLPMDTTRFQSIAWSGGIFTQSMAQALERRLEDTALRDKALVLVVHHPPFYPRSASPWMRWIDGLRGCAEVLDLLSRHPRLQLLHGHLHRVVDRILSSGSSERVEAAAWSTDRPPLRTRLFGAPATCDGAENADASRVRLYDVQDGALASATHAA